MKPPVRNTCQILLYFNQHNVSSSVITSCGNSVITRYHSVASHYAKLGYVQADIITQENLGTGSTYGNETLDGYQFAFGVKSDLANNMFFKTEFFVTDYDDIKITSSGDNIVEGDIDVRGISLAVGYQF